MRYLPTLNGPTARGLDPGGRPPLDMIPKALHDALQERDRIMEQRSEAVGLVASLAGAEVEAAARKVDEDAAAVAARKGAKIPAPVAMPKLEREREEADRAAAAQEAALLAATNDAEQAKSDLFWATDEQVTADKAKTRAQVEAAANKLADMVEAAVAANAVHAWLRYGIYYPPAATWPTEVLPLEHHGLSRQNTQPIAVREILTRAATTVLQED